MRINFASTRLAFVLIALLLFLVLLSALIPQRELSEHRIVDWQRLLGDNYRIIEALGLDRIYYTPTFFVVLGLLGLNLFVGNVRRLKAVYRAEGTLIRTRYIGSIIFHFSVLMILVAIILNYLFKYDGVLALTEGQQVEDRPEHYFREFIGPLRARQYDRFTLKLERVQTDYPVGDAVATAAVVQLRGSVGGGDLVDTARTNHPVRLPGLEIHFGQVSGYSLELVVIDTSGSRLFSSFVRLANQERDGERVAADFYVVPHLGLRVEVIVIPPAIDSGSSTYQVTVQDQDTLLFEGIVASTDTIRAGNYFIALPRLRRWCYLDVVSSPFLFLVFAGFWSGLLGLTVGFVPRVLGERRNG